MNNPHVFIINLRDYKEQTINYKKILVNNIINGQNLILHYSGHPHCWNSVAQMLIEPLRPLSVLYYLQKKLPGDNLRKLASLVLFLDSLLNLLSLLDLYQIIKFTASLMGWTKTQITIK